MQEILNIINKVLHESFYARSELRKNFSILAYERLQEIESQTVKLRAIILGEKLRRMPVKRIDLNAVKKT